MILSSSLIDLDVMHSYISSFITRCCYIIHIVLWLDNSVGKQGERGEAKVSSGQTRLGTRWRGVKERRSVRTRERYEDPSTSRFTFAINLFITILIGLKLPTFLFYVWTEDIFLFGPFTGILSIRKGTLR